MGFKELLHNSFACVAQPFYHWMLDRIGTTVAKFVLMEGRSTLSGITLRFERLETASAPYREVVFDVEYTAPHASNSGGSSGVCTVSVKEKQACMKVILFQYRTTLSLQPDNKISMSYDRKMAEAMESVTPCVKPNILRHFGVWNGIDPVCCGANMRKELHWPLAGSPNIRALMEFRCEQCQKVLFLGDMR